MPYTIKGEQRNTGRTHFKKGHIPSHKGKNLSKEHIENLKKSHKGKKPNNALEIWRKRGGVPWNKGKKRSKETKDKMSKSLTGKRRSKETRRKMSLARRKENNSNWKGGVSSENSIVRGTTEIKLWRKSVFERDNFTCQKYGISGGILNAHHINNFADFPELRTSIENGITLSEKAHREFHSKYGRKNNTREQLEEFLNNE